MKKYINRDITFSGSAELNLDQLHGLIVKWGEDKGLLSNDKKFVQLAKITEELGELAGAMIKCNQPLIIDSLGDVLVTVILLSEQLGYDLTYCLNSAYNEIKDRTGKLSQDGSFIKD